MTRLRADALLLLTALIWGTAFVAQKNGNAHIGPLTFVGTRFLLSALLLAPLAMLENRKTAAPPAEAALIMSLESVFAAIAGAMLLRERLTTPALFGCFLILLGVVMAELGPTMRRRADRSATTM